MNFSQFVSVVRARWLLGLAVLLGATVVGLAYSLLAQRTYTSSATVMLDLVSPDVANGLGAGALAPTYMATQVDLISSERVALKAIDLLGLQRDASLKEKWMAGSDGRGDFKVWLASGLRQDLEVRPSRESNVITIRYTSTNAEHAARVTNAFVEAYTETSLDLRVEPARQFREMYEERAAQGRSALEAAQARLSEHQRVNGMVSGGFDGRLDLEGVRLSELSSQLVQLQALASESQSRRDEVARGAERLTEVRGDPAVVQLRIDLAREQSRLEELDQRYGDQHPQVQEQRARIVELRTRLNAAVQNASGSLVAGNNVNQSRVTQVQSAIATQREKLMQLKSIRDRADVLQRDVESARQAYDAIVLRLNQTDLASRTAQTNVAVVQSASAPLRPTSPKTVLNTIAAFMAGGVLGLSAIIVAEVRDRRVRTVHEITGDLQQSLLLAMPRVQFLVDDAGEERGTSRFRPLKAARRSQSVEA